MNYFSNLKIREIDFINLKFFLSLLIIFFIGKKEKPFLFEILWKWFIRFGRLGLGYGWKINKYLKSTTCFCASEILRKHNKWKQTKGHGWVKYIKEFDSPISVIAIIVILERGPHACICVRVWFPNKCHRYNCYIRRATRL